MLYKNVGLYISEKMTNIKTFPHFNGIFHFRSSADGEWLDLLKQCQEHPAVRGMTLTSYLLKPMQRITKYPLLVKQVQY